MMRAAVCVALVCAAAPAGAQPFKGTKQPDVRYVPSPDSVVDAMLEFARVTAGDIVYDLGSGDGRIPIAAAKRYGAFGVGVEIDAKLNREAADNARKAGVTDRVRFFTQDLFEADISQATVVTLFLLPRLNRELIPKLRRELRPGTRIVSHQFDMGEQWPPEQAQDVNGLTIYLWTVKPGGLAGRLRLGGRDVPDDEDALAGADQAELAAGDLFDRAGVLAQAPRLIAEPRVFRPLARDRGGQFVVLVPGAQHREQSAVADQAVDNNDRGDQDQQDLHDPPVARRTPFFDSLRHVEKTVQQLA